MAFGLTLNETKRDGFKQIRIQFWFNNFQVFLFSSLTTVCFFLFLKSEANAFNPFRFWWCGEK